MCDGSPIFLGMLPGGCFLKKCDFRYEIDSAVFVYQNFRRFSPLVLALIYVNRPSDMAILLFGNTRFSQTPLIGFTDVFP